MKVRPAIVKNKSQKVDKMAIDFLLNFETMGGVETMGSIEASSPSKIYRVEKKDPPFIPEETKKITQIINFLRIKENHYYCTLCDPSEPFSHRNRNTFRQHLLRTHIKPYSCTQCKKSLSISCTTEAKNRRKCCTYTSPTPPLRKREDLLDLLNELISQLSSSTT